MRFVKDNIIISPQLQFDIFIANGDNNDFFMMHFHDCLEINYIINGSGTNFIEDKQFELCQGDIYVINNLERHKALTNGELKMLVIVVKPSLVLGGNSSDYEFLEPFFNRNINFSNCIKSGERDYCKLEEIILEIWSEWNMKEEGFRLVLKSLLLKLFAILYRHYKLNQSIGEGLSEFRKSYDRIRDALDYMHDHFQNDISLDDIAKKSCMNRTYFSSFFKKVMGMGTNQYLESLRLESAARMINLSSHQMMNISLECGFNSISNFNRAFRKYFGVSPTEFKSKNLNK